MSDNTNTNAQAAPQPTPKKQDPPTQADAQSVLSDTSTLCGDSAAAAATKQDQSTTATKKAVKLSDSAGAFAKKAKQEGWGAPTATRPSLGA
uniref:Cwt1p n=1 Tax=Ganoderma boninense TaxID=34458 RepID=A0A5K1K3S1_9APHY|nr:Cwt1p [Ganoderma boninense]